jgi:hypothetical protein
VQKTVISPNGFTTLGLAGMIGVDGGQQHLRMFNGQYRRAFNLTDRVHGDSFSVT